MERKPKRVYHLTNELRVEVYAPRNPVENLIGGQVKIRRRKK